ncbi:MAG TPA: hypothetical protein ENN42_02170 [Thioalkalivibrio sp.]|nr:hypothetical protein [Thioalkalivibrio sp.]
MVGRKNIVFGFLFLVLTAALGPYMVTQFDAVGEAQAARNAAMSDLRLRVDGGFMDEATLETLEAEQIARTNAEALLALNTGLNARAPIDTIKSGPHAHGNLEALLNIAVGVVLVFLAVPVWLKQAVSWLFIVGTLLHSGMLYLLLFDLAWAGTLLGTGIGPILILLGLLLAGIAAAIGFRGEPVRDPERGG